MQDEPIKICANCGAEYSLEAMTCADCGGKLVFPEEFDQLSVPLEAAEEEVLIRQSTVDHLRELGALLKKKGIRSAVRYHGCPPGTCRTKALYGLYVKPIDETAAKEIDRNHWLRGAPDHASSYRYEEQELQGVCPACSTTIPEGSRECPECGLVVHQEEEIAVCPDCEAEVGDEVQRCPNCGAEFE